MAGSQVFSAPVVEGHGGGAGPAYLAKTLEAELQAIIEPWLPSKPRVCAAGGATLDLSTTHIGIRVASTIPLIHLKSQAGIAQHWRSTYSGDKNARDSIAQLLRPRLSPAGPTNGRALPGRPAAWATRQHQHHKPDRLAALRGGRCLPPSPIGRDRPLGGLWFACVLSPAGDCRCALSQPNLPPSRPPTLFPKHWRGLTKRVSTRDWAAALADGRQERAFREAAVSDDGDWAALDICW